MSRYRTALNMVIVALLVSEIVALALLDTFGYSNWAYFVALVFVVTVLLSVRVLYSDRSDRL